MNKEIKVETYGVWEIRPDIQRIGHKGLWIKEKDVKELQKLIDKRGRNKNG